MVIFGLILHIVTIMSLMFEFRCEMTADSVFSLLSDRFDQLERVTYNMKSELRSSVAAINNRIDNIEEMSKSQSHSNTYSTEMHRKRNEMVHPENMNPNERILKALASEKIHVRNVLTDYEESFIEFQRAVSDQLKVMNTTIEASHEKTRRKLEENTGNINKQVHQLMTNSEIKFQFVVNKFEAAMNNTANEHKTTRSDLNEVKSTVKDIEDDLNKQTIRINAMESDLSAIKIPPSIAVAQRNVSTEENRSVELRCDASGRPPPVVSWKKSGGQLPVQYKIQDGVLTIYDVRVEDAGRYICTASSSSGSSDDYVVLEVAIPPSIAVDQRHVHTWQKRMVKLRCDALGRPPPVVSWKKSGGQLPAKHKILDGTLTMFDVRREDSGRYICTASNSFGSSDDYVTLFVASW